VVVPPLLLLIVIGAVVTAVPSAEASGPWRRVTPTLRMNSATQNSSTRVQVPGREWYETLRFSCSPRVFQLIREEPNRFPREHTAYSMPSPGQSSWKQGPLDTLAPNQATDSHPYPVELLLPRWTLEEDWDLRTWLFRWGAGVRIEQPNALRELHRQEGQEVADLYKSNTEE